MGTSSAQIVVQSLEPNLPKLLAQKNGYSLLEFDANENALQAKALELSRSLKTLTLAILNQEDTRLVLAAYQNGEWLEYYDSNPMYLGCRVCSYAEDSINGEGGDALKLTELFGVPEKAKALRHWLVRKPGLGFLYERERLEAIAEILRIPLAIPQSL